MLNKYDVATIAATNDLEGGWQKLPASKQRELFGFVAFGRKDVHFDGDGQGIVRVAASKAFGTDCVVTQFSYAQFAEICNKREKIEI